MFTVPYKWRSNQNTDTKPYCVSLKISSQVFIATTYFKDNIENKRRVNNNVIKWSILVSIYKLLKLLSLNCAQVLPFDDNLCVREPCLNFEHCLTVLKFGNASGFISSESVLFRPIYPVSTFACRCPSGFTGNLYVFVFASVLVIFKERLSFHRKMFIFNYYVLMYFWMLM